MVERLKKIPTRLLELWNKYTSKQKTIIISVVATIFLALIILITIMGRTKYEVLTTCESTKEAGKVVELLKDEGIAYTTSSDQLTIYVDSKDLTNAVFLMASNDMPSTGLAMEDLLNNSLSTTNSDRTLKVNLFFQNQVRNYLLGMEGIDDAQVSYIPVEKNNSILSENQNTTASVLLNVNDDFKMSSAPTIAELVASVIGNSSTEGIKVVDQHGNLLFGGSDDLYSGSASSNEDFKERLRNNFENNLYSGLIKIGFDDVEIMANLDFNMDKVTELYTEYTPAEGQEQGLYSHSYTYETEGTSGSGGVAGTASNDETTYEYEDGDNTASSSVTEEYDYLPNTRVTNTEFEVGAINTDASSVSIVLTDVVTYAQEDLELQGLLNDMTFDEYVLANSARKSIEVDDDIYKLISNATGIAEEKIAIVAYEQPIFVPTVQVEKSLTEYLPYILAGLIILLLVFIVFRTAAPVEITETEPELSVEQLLATTKETQSIENIEFDDKSETRKMIEKFVDENPEAVANLLRNWLSDDWD